MPIPPRTGISGLQTASPTTSASSLPRPCMVSSRPAYRTPKSYGSWLCSGRKIATAGAWVLRSLRHSPISCLCCRRRKPISRCFTAHAAWRRIAMARHRGGNARRLAADRILLTAIAAGFSPAELADALFAAETERAFADTGHSLDFINKAFECLDLIGWQHAAALLPTVVGQMVAARGAEESTAWRQPVDLVALCEESTSKLADLFAAGRSSGDWSGHAALAQELLGDDPAGIVDALKQAIRAGAAPADLGQSLAYAAALRVARFGNANEHADWETAHHVFTYANAVHQM